MRLYSMPIHQAIGRTISQVAKDVPSFKAATRDSQKDTLAAIMMIAETLDAYVQLPHAEQDHNAFSAVQSSLHFVITELSKYHNDPTGYEISTTGLSRLLCMCQLVMYPGL